MFLALLYDWCMVHVFIFTLVCFDSSIICLNQNMLYASSLFKLVMIDAMFFNISFLQVHKSRLFVFIREVPLHWNIAHLAIYLYIYVSSIAIWLMQRPFLTFTLVFDYSIFQMYANIWTSLAVLILCITSEIHKTTHCTLAIVTGGAIATISTNSLLLQSVFFRATVWS